jgi:hypothetical protein
VRSHGDFSVYPACYKKVKWLNLLEVQRLNVAVELTNRINNKNKKNNKKKTVLVRLQKTAVTLGDREKQKKITGFETDAECYAKTLQDPFPPSCEGVRIPSFGGLITPKTGRAHGTITITTSATGLAACVLLPSITMSGIISAGAFSGGTTGFTASNNAVYNVYGDVLAASADKYRTVCAGYRLKNLQPFNTVTGRVWVIPVPLSDVHIPYTYLQSGTAVPSANLSDIYIGYGSNMVTYINQPGAMEYTFDQLINNQVLAVSRPIDPSGLAWKQSRVTATSDLNSTDTLGGEFIAINTSLGTAVTSTHTIDNTTNMSGQVGFVIYISGCPNSSAVMEVEYIHHYEYIGNGYNGVTNTNVIVPTSRAVPMPKGMYISPEEVLGKLAAIPFQRLVPATVMNKMAGMAMSTGRSFMQKLLV